jgi:hypothetical protein
LGLARVEAAVASLAWLRFGGVELKRFGRSSFGLTSLLREGSLAVFFVWAVFFELTKR